MYTFWHKYKLLEIPQKTKTKIRQNFLNFVDVFVLSMQGVTKLFLKKFSKLFA